MRPSTPSPLFTALVAIAVMAASAGADWQWQNPLPTGNSLEDVCFVDANVGWAVGAAGTLLHTTDGGTTWSILSCGIASSLDEVFFLNADTGWVVGGETG